MIINTAGEYTLQYTATDACGNTTTVERELVVEAPPRTVLYTDGTLIINELSRDIDANIAAHGQPTNIYAPFNPNGATNLDKYIFANNGEQPWATKQSNIVSVEIGSQIYPTSTAHWFESLMFCTSINLAKLDTSFVTDMNGMFRSCQNLTSLDLSSFNTSSVTNMVEMFRNNTAITTIYASDLFVVTQVTDSTYMFNNMSTNLVGGAGTVWSSSYTDKTRAKIDGGTSDPGYFTAKS